MSFRVKRRSFVHLLYWMLKEKKGFFLVVQEMDLEEEVYLNWKKKAKESGGFLSRWAKEELDLERFSFLFGGRSFSIFWPEWIGIESYREWKKELEEKNTFILCVLYKGFFLYEEELLSLLQGKAGKKKNLCLGLKKFPLKLMSLSKKKIFLWAKLKRYANITSIKEKSKT